MSDTPGGGSNQATGRGTGPASSTVNSSQTDAGNRNVSAKQTPASASGGPSPQQEPPRASFAAAAANGVASTQPAAGKTLKPAAAGGPGPQAVKLPSGGGPRAPAGPLQFGSYTPGADDEAPPAPGAQQQKIDGSATANGGSSTAQPSQAPRIPRPPPLNQPPGAPAGQAPGNATSAAQRPPGSGGPQGQQPPQHAQQPPMGQSPPQPGAMAMQRQASGQGASRPTQGQQGGGGGHSRKGSQGVPQHLQSAPMQMYPTMPSGSMGLPPGLQQQMPAGSYITPQGMLVTPQGAFMPPPYMANMYNPQQQMYMGGPPYMQMPPGLHPGQQGGPQGVYGPQQQQPQPQQHPGHARQGSYGGGPHPGQQQPGGPQHGPQSPQQPRLQRPPGGGGRGGSHQQGQPQHPASMQPGQQPQPGAGQQAGRGGGGQPAAAPKVVQPPPRRTLKLVDPKTGESLDLSAARKEAAAKAAAHRTEPGAAARDGPPGLARPGSAPSRADSTASGVSATSGTSAPTAQPAARPVVAEKRPIAIVAPSDAPSKPAAAPSAPTKPAASAAADSAPAAATATPQPPAGTPAADAAPKDAPADPAPASAPAAAAVPAPPPAEDEAAKQRADETAAKARAEAIAKAEAARAEAEVAAKAEAKAKAEQEAAKKASDEAAAKQKAEAEAAAKRLADEEAAAKAKAEEAQKAAEKAAAEKAELERANAERAAKQQAEEQAAAQAAAEAEKSAAEADKCAAEAEKAEEAALAQTAAESASDQSPALEKELADATGEAHPGKEADGGAAAPALSAKAKRKAAMARAEEKGTGDMMDAYTAPKEKDETPSPSQPATPSQPPPPPPPLTTRPSIASHPIVSPPKPGLSREVSAAVDEDWEDAPDAPLAALRLATAKLSVSDAAEGASPDGKKRYSRDWLLNQQQYHTGEPVGLERIDELRSKPGEGAAGGPGGMGAPRGGPAGSFNRRDSMPPNFGGRGAGPPGGMGMAPPGMMTGRGGPPDDRRRGSQMLPEEPGGGRWGHAPMPGGGGQAGGFGGPQRGGPPGPPGMMRAASGRPGGVQADVWSRGTQQAPLTPGGPLSGIQLHKTEKSFKVGQVVSDDPEEEKKQKAFNGLLNKLTPDNFERILEKMFAIGIIAPKTLRGLIDRIFDKALTEVTFTELYAELCVRLSAKLPAFEDPDAAPPEDGQPAKKSITFRRVLLNKCQEEFEAGDQAMAAVDAREKAAAAKVAAGEKEEEDEEDEEDAAKDAGTEKPAADKAESPAKEDAKEEKEEGEISPAKPAETKAEKKRRERIEEARRAAADYKARQRMLGNIQFIGQLYIKKMLTERIMHECIVKLLGEVSNPRQEDVESLVKLVRTIGGTLEESGTKEAKSRMDIYFGRIQALSQSEKLESRVRFALQDLREMRYNGWRERRKAEGPKKIAEVHAEAAEQLRQQAARSSGPRGGRGMPMDRGGGGRRDMSDYGGPPRGQIGTRMEVGRMQTADRVDAPIRAMARTPSQEFLGPARALRPGGGGAPPSRMGGVPQPPRDASPPRQRKPLELKPRSGTSDASGAPPTAPGSGRPPTPPQPSADAAAPAAATPSPGQKDAETRCKSLVTEYSQLKSDSEAIAAFQDIAALQPDLVRIVERMFAEAMEARGTDWAAIGALYATLHKAELLPGSALEPGFRKLLDALPDTAIDAPRAPVIIGEMTGDLVAAGAVDLEAMAQHVLQAGEPAEEDGGDPGLIDSDNAAPVMGAALQRLKDTQGEDAAKAAWDATGLQLSAFLFAPDREDPKALEKLVDKFGLQFLSA